MLLPSHNPLSIHFTFLSFWKICAQLCYVVLIPKYSGLKIPHIITEDYHNIYLEGQKLILTVYHFKKEFAILILF